MKTKIKIEFSDEEMEYITNSSKKLGVTNFEFIRYVIRCLMNKHEK